MEQAEAFTTNEAVSFGTCACVRLRQGSSARASWNLEECAGGTTITVGSGPTCDWQIRAAFVPPHALSVLFVNGRVYVRPGPEHGVLLNGHGLGDDGWAPVEEGDRLDVGLARLEIGAAAAPATTGNWLKDDARPYESEAYASDAPLPESARERETLRGLDSGTYRISNPDAVPAVLDRDDSPDRSALWRYALAGVATACAYGGWVVLLDFL